jgi:hypothetical protein
MTFCLADVFVRSNADIKFDSTLRVTAHVYDSLLLQLKSIIQISGCRVSMDCLGNSTQGIFRISYVWWINITQLNKQLQTPVGCVLKGRRYNLGSCPNFPLSFAGVVMLNYVKLYSPFCLVDSWLEYNERHRVVMFDSRRIFISCFRVEMYVKSQLKESLNPGLGLGSECGRKSSKQN